jgi:hypothetical protein
LCALSAGKRIGALRLERASPQHGRSATGRDEDNLAFVRGDGGIERVVAGSEL